MTEAVSYGDLVKPATYANDEYAQQLFSHMRNNQPVAWIDEPTHRPFWAITKHADIIAISRANDKFINAPRPVLIEKEEEDRRADAPVQSRVLIGVDGEDHKALRDLTKDWFLPESLKRFDAQIRELATETVDHMLSLGEEIDFVKDVAVWYPLRVIMKILGAPEEKNEMMLTLTQQMFGSSDPDIRREFSDEERMALFGEFYQYCMQVTAERRNHPEEDLASVIANGSIHGEPITDMDLMGYFLIVASAGHDTTSSSTAGAIHALMHNPDEMKKVRNNPGLMPSMVDESIRWVTPVKHFMRTATKDYDLRGTTIKAGESVMLLYPSANRDEEVFDAPFEFHADRRPNRHLAFGHGAHHCLGNLLAKAEMRILYEEMFSRVKSIEPNGEAKLIESSFVSGLKTLPVRIKPV